MDWQVAAPYVAAAAALTVGLLSALLAVKNTRRTLEQQRALSREQRLWEKRAETYVELLEWSAKASSVVYEALEREEEALKASDSGPLAAMPAPLSARVLAFGSDAVVAAVEHVHQAARVDADAIPAEERTRRDNATRELERLREEAAGGEVSSEEWRLGIEAIRGSGTQFVSELARAGALRSLNGALDELRAVVRHELQLEAETRR